MRASSSVPLGNERGCWPKPKADHYRPDDHAAPCPTRRLPQSRKPAREVRNGSNRGRDPKTAPDRSLGRRNPAAADQHPDEPGRAACTGQRGLDWAARWDVETVKPGGGWAAEDRSVRKAKPGRHQPRHRRIGDLMPGIDAGSRRQLPPSSCALDTPCRRASSTVNGLSVSPGGMRGIGAMPRMLVGVRPWGNGAC